MRNAARAAMGNPNARARSDLPAGPKARFTRATDNAAIGP